MEKITAHPEAAEELRQAIQYYEDKSVGLGERFFEEAIAFLAHIRTNPFRYSPRTDGIHRANLHCFPFHVAYLIERDVICVVAIAHNKRAPFYWRKRLPKLGDSFSGIPLSDV